MGIRFALSSFSPGALALLRYLVASIVILPLFLMLPKRQTVTKSEWPMLVILGIIGFGIYNVALNYGEITVYASIASFIISLIPVTIMILAVIFLRERLTIKQVVGAIISVIGITVISFGELEQARFDWGVVFCLVATLCAATYSVMQKPLLKKFHAIEITSYSIWFGTLMMLIYLPQLMSQLPHATNAAIWSVIYMGIFPAVIAYACWTYALAHRPATQAAGYLYLIPFITVVMAWLLLREFPTWIALVGGVIALIGAMIIK